MGVRSQRARHENFDQSTGEVLLDFGCRDDGPMLCPRVQWISATSVPTESTTQYEFGGVCWVNLCNITASSAMFLSSPDLAAA